MTFLSILHPTWTCFIQGQDGGICVNPSEYREDYFGICSGLITYRTCVPKTFTSTNPNLTVANKVRWIENTYKEVVENQMALEQNKTYRQNSIFYKIIYSIVDEVHIRFYHNKDCQQAYLNYICWSNFPRCDEEDRSLMLCRSVCENYAKACKLSKDLKRCGPTEYQNGYNAEKAEYTDVKGYTKFYRDFYPGQPFRDGKFDGRKPLPVCTPSILNNSITFSPSFIILIVSILLSFLLV